MINKFNILQVDLAIAHACMHDRSRASAACLQCLRELELHALQLQLAWAHGEV